MSNSVSVTQGVIETMHWISIEELISVTAYPVFMKSLLQFEHKIVLIVTDVRNNDQK